MDKVLVSNIQRFSLHDGPGIRTTVFLKGCAVHCPWCCNPENISNKIQVYGENGITKEWGRWYTAQELIDEILKDKGYYIGELSQENYIIQNEALIDCLPGGVTFSGGEALLQASKINAILLDLRKQGIHIALETSLFAPTEKLQEVISLIDLFYVDIKIVDVSQCKSVVGGNIDLYKTNLSIVANSMRPMIIRVPVIGGYTDNKKNIDNICEMLSGLYSHQNNILRVELLPGHHLGDSKYEKLGKTKPVFQLVDDMNMKWIKNVIEQSGFKTIINKM